MAKRLPALVAEYTEIKKILDRAREVDDGEPLAAEARSRPFPPASAAAIRAFEKKVGASLPPSYREFLALHNGWQCFWGSMWIGGVDGKSRAYVQARLREGKSHLRTADWDPRSALVLGADDNGGFLVFSAQADKNGERKVLDCPRGFTENTFASFADLLATQLCCRVNDVARLPKAQRR